MFNKITEFFQKRKFPKTIEKVWFAGNGIEKDKSKNKYFVPYWNKDGKYINYSKGDVVPMLTKEGYTAYYKITGWKRYCSWGSDTAMWDDAREYNLKLNKIVKFNSKETITI